MHLLVYFDYTCPYSYAAAVWLQHLESTEHEVTIDWRPFIVKEVNRPPGEDEPFWEQEGAPQTRTGLAFLAGQAAARQGADASGRFRLLLQEAFHLRHLDISRPGVLTSLADEAGLDVARFEADRHIPDLLGEVGVSHQEAVARDGVFGTPTLVFSNGCAVYLKLAEAPIETEAPRVFALLRELVEQHPIVHEIKLTRPEGA
jgi:predicted DsbA family dithiol-disulfide isomerase